MRPLVRCAPVREGRGLHFGARTGGGLGLRPKMQAHLPRVGMTRYSVDRLCSADCSNSRCCSNVA